MKLITLIAAGFVSCLLTFNGLAQNVSAYQPAAKEDMETILVSALQKLLQTKHRATYISKSSHVSDEKEVGRGENVYIFDYETENRFSLSEEAYGQPTTKKAINALGKKPIKYMLSTKVFFDGNAFIKLGEEEWVDFSLTPNWNYPEIIKAQINDLERQKSGGVHYRFLSEENLNGSQIAKWELKLQPGNRSSQTETIWIDLKNNLLLKKRIEFIRHQSTIPPSSISGTTETVFDYGASFEVAKPVKNEKKKSKKEKH